MFASADGRYLNVATTPSGGLVVGALTAAEAAGSKCFPQCVCPPLLAPPDAPPPPKPAHVHLEAPVLSTPRPSQRVPVVFLNRQT
jgi:hypothetical protein